MDRTDRLVNVVREHPESLATASPDMLRLMATMLENAANNPERDDAAAFLARLSFEDTMRDIRQALTVAPPDLRGYVQRHGGSMPVAAVVAAIASGGTWETVLYAMRKTKYMDCGKRPLDHGKLYKLFGRAGLAATNTYTMWIDTHPIAAALGRRGGACFRWLREPDRDKVRALFGTEVGTGDWWPDYFSTALEEGRRNEGELAAELAAVFDMSSGAVTSYAKHAATGGYVAILSAMAALDASLAESLFSAAITNDRVKVLEYLRQAGGGRTFFTRLQDYDIARSGFALALQVRAHGAFEWLVQHMATVANLPTLPAIGFALSAGDVPMAESLRRRGLGVQTQTEVAIDFYNDKATVAECMGVLDWIQRHGFALEAGSSLYGMNVLSRDRLVPVARRLYTAFHIPVLSPHFSMAPVALLEIVAMADIPGVMRWLVEEGGFRVHLSWLVVHALVAQTDRPSMRMLAYLLAQHCPVNYKCVDLAEANGHMEAAAKIQAAIIERGESFV